MRHIFQSLRRDSRIPLPYLAQDSKICESCEAPCEKICEIIKKDSQGIYLDFSARGCTFCEECAKVCEKKILDISFKKIRAQVKINIESCLAWNKILCNHCAESCEHIKFHAGLYPEILESCTKCGMCVSACDSIYVLKELD